MRYSNNDGIVSQNTQLASLKTAKCNHITYCCLVKMASRLLGEGGTISSEASSSLDALEVLSWAPSSCLTLPSPPSLRVLLAASMAKHRRAWSREVKGHLRAPPTRKLQLEVNLRAEVCGEKMFAILCNIAQFLDTTEL